MERTVELMEAVMVVVCHQEWMERKVELTKTVMVELQEEAL
jgi:hypothetical protein